MNNIFVINILCLLFLLFYPFFVGDEKISVLYIKQSKRNKNRSLERKNIKLKSISYCTAQEITDKLSTYFNQIIYFYDKSEACKQELLSYGPFLKSLILN